jgi:hypothetical protein
MKVQFNVSVDEDLSAGIIGYSDIVTVEVSDANKDRVEFASFLCECLEEWYDGVIDYVIQN